MGLHLASPPESFSRALRGELGGRAWLLRDPDRGGYEASSPRLQPLADFLACDRRDSRAHEAVFLGVGRGTGALFAAVIHSTRRGQAQGGVRLRPYPTLEALLRDGLRLSSGMTRKNALAGLWWGGGKALVARPPGERIENPDFRRAIYQEFGAFVSSLQGCYVTAEDAGTCPADMAEVFRATRFTTCIPPERGGAGNPSRMTAAGVACAMEAALDFLGLGGVEGKTVALQGTGQVGSALVAQLVERGAGRIVASETDASRRDTLLDRFDGAPVEVRLVPENDLSILAEPCDVLAPCAMGAVLDAKTIPDVRARLVCGAANNPLADEARDDAALAARGIHYVPDFLANRMGIVQVANEQYGALSDDPAVRRHLEPDWEHGIPATVRRILEAAASHGTTPLAEALKLADERACEPHPLWGHRGLAIIESLARNGWVSAG